MADQHRHHGGARGILLMVRLHAQQVGAVGDFAGGFAAGVEAGLAPGALAVQGEQPEAFALLQRRRLAARLDPVFQYRLGQAQQMASRIGCCRIDRVEGGLYVGERSHAKPFSFRKPRESETFSCTPTFRALRPRAMPSNWVK